MLLHIPMAPADSILGPGKRTYRISAMPPFPPLPLVLLWVEPADGEGGGSGKRKSADVERKTVMLIYPYPQLSVNVLSIYFNWHLGNSFNKILF
jgi:hypothetical protein